MSEVIQELYESRAYPAMSHPLSDPAVSAVAALLAGLRTRHPSKARILEIGCCSGLNLIPLALRWPNSRFTGIDLSAPSIRQARELADAAGATNVEFHAVDLRDFEDESGGFDFIIAHGFLSWVPDEVKSALFGFCHRHLAPQGIATVSFNLLCGWQPRFPVIQKARAIQVAGAGDPMSALAILRSVTQPESPELAIIDDMLAKGPEILAFDDFGPVNDPWPLDRFVHAAGAAGLRWLGESDPGLNLPRGLDPETVESLRGSTPDLISFHLAADAATGRTFRSGIICRHDAAIDVRISLERMFELSVRAGVVLSGDVNKRMFETIDLASPQCVQLDHIQSSLPDFTRNQIARWVYEGIQSGWIVARIETVVFNAGVPAMPDLGRFRLECARRRLPLVDIWHQPCSFPETHYEVLVRMDGSRTTAELEALSKSHTPELDFVPWLAHLAGRGMFA